MDSDHLQAYGATLAKCAQFQEVTEAAELMDPQRIELNVFYDSSGVPSQQVEPRTLQALLAAVQASKDGQATHFPPLPHSKAATPQPCTRHTGVVAVATHTFNIFKWMQKGRDIAEPRTYTELRRPRKDTLLSGLPAKRGATRGPPPPPSVEEHGDDRQFMSVAVVLYGRPNFMVQDECYFREDGRLGIIDRFLVAPVDASAPLFVADRAAFFNLDRGRIDRANETHPVVDFSFKDMSSPLDMLRTQPHTGQPHRVRPVFRPPEDTTNKERVMFAAADGSNQQQATRKLVVARNRRGEEEAYEFEVKPVLKADAEDLRPEDSLLKGLAERLVNKFDAEVVRLCNNVMTNADSLVPVLRSLVASSFLTVQWLDLSNNRLVGLPDLTPLPLRSLYVHANNISDWEVIETRVCVLPLLSAVTCHGNPIATTDAEYKQQLLMRLQRAKRLLPNAVAIKTVDFVTVSACDVHVATMFARFTKGGTINLKNASNPGTPRGGTTPRSPRNSGRSPR